MKKEHVFTVFIDLEKNTKQHYGTLRDIFAFGLECCSPVLCILCLMIVFAWALLFFGHIFSGDGYIAGSIFSIKIENIVSCMKTDLE